MSGCQTGWKANQPHCVDRSSDINAVVFTRVNREGLGDNPCGIVRQIRHAGTNRVPTPFVFHELNRRGCCKITGEVKGTLNIKPLGKCQRSSPRVDNREKFLRHVATRDEDRSSTACTRPLVKSTNPVVAVE